MEPDPHSDFHSSETGAPFRDCISCGLPFDHAPETPYLVAKSYRRGECIFEYAICEDCRTSMSREFSRDSRQALNLFFQERVNLSERSSLLSHQYVPAPWIQKCAACEKPRNEAESYSLGGMLLGSDMIYDPYPLCLCGNCEEEIQSLLSPGTKGIWDEFVDTHFDGPPSNLEDLPVKGRPVLF
ncbi:MAG: hypothetical protein CMN02_03260 [Roseibacillus sp.]|nr:hypothetical protein [Roseibacillus sp.]